jgi:hypothetical protein
VEVLKNRIVIILGVLNVIFLLIAINSCSQSKRCISVKRSEEIKRYDAEQELNKIAAERSAIEAKLQKTESVLVEEKAAVESTQKTLLQEQLISKALKAELEKMRKLNDALEQDLKNALVSGKTEKPKK